MRLKTLIVPAFILCLLALAVWQTSQALPGLIFEVICHSVVLCFSYKSYRLWAGLLWAIIGALNTSVLLYEAGQIWLGAAVGISLQLWKGPQLPRYNLFHPAQGVHQMCCPAMGHHLRRCVTMLAAIYATLCHLRPLPSVSGVALPLDITADDCLQA